MREILLATRNRGKVREIEQLTADAGWTWRGLDDFPDIPDVVEDGATFAENARKKALHYAAATGLTTLADDSGLEVDGLDGKPGVHSARYAGSPKSDAANNRKLVEALRGVPAEKWTARFRCAMALVGDGEVVAETSGAVEGRIVAEPRGDGGFGYDPHFFVGQCGKRMAELPPETKNAISHRGQAMRAMVARMGEGIEGLRD